VSFLWNGIRQGFDLIIHGDSYTWHLVWITIKVAAISTGIALALGIPLGLLIGLGRRAGRGRRTRGGAPWASALGNAGLFLPPVLVGIVLFLLMVPAAPLGGLHLLFTLDGVIVAQTVLAFPIVVALTAASVRSLPPGLFSQARALGANTPQIWVLALREARIGVFAATIAALGSAFSEVGAVVIVGGNIEGSTQTLASAALEQTNAGHYGQAMAIGMILIGLILIVAAALTVLQLGSSRAERRWRAQAAT
jgi:tungstate transport system permease protein